MKAVRAVLGCLSAAFAVVNGDSALLTLSTAGGEVLSDMGQGVISVLSAIPQRKCMPIFLTDGTTSYITLYKEFGQMLAPWGVSVFEVSADGQHPNVTLTQLSWVVGEARRVRRFSWCVMVVVASNDPLFLAGFAEASLKGRLLVWATRLLVVSRFTFEEVRSLLGSHWTFSMTNSMLLTAEDKDLPLRCRVYVHLPYSPHGARVVQVASWTRHQGLGLLTTLPIFPEKFANFFGATVNVTSHTYIPYWMISGEGSNMKHRGIDYNQITTLAQALNFTLNILLFEDWAPVTGLVEARIAFIASIVYVILPSRLEIYDYTRPFDYSPFCFAMAKPKLKPQWQSLYYPLSRDVWVAILITRTEVWKNRHSSLDYGAIVQEVTGTLFGQGFTGRLATRGSNSLLVALWLMVVFILGTVYRGNLTAYLTQPSYPPRPENVEELVQAIERATIEPYGFNYKNSFTNSGSSAFSALGKLMYVGVDVVDGLKDALKMKGAHVGGRQYLESNIVEHFTREDGYSPIYIGREMIVPSPTAWPIPHDAPYKPRLDHYIMAITEAGLYEQWRKEMMLDALRQSRTKRREALNKKGQMKKDPISDLESEDGSIKALNLVHLQGPLMLLLPGLCVAGIIFLVERLTVSSLTHKQGCSPL